MKKVFVSMPMKGKSPGEIALEQNRILALAAEKFGGGVELVPNFLGGEELAPLECLGESLKRMATADGVVFGEGWESARGCKIERLCAEKYGIPILNI